MTMTNTYEWTAEDERAHNIARIKELAPQGSEVTGIVRTVNRMGDRRVINLLVSSGGAIVKLDGFLVGAGLYKMNPRGEMGLVVGGGGMDMIAATVANIARHVHGWEGALTPRTLS
jgi:hypothetical protein